MQKDRTNRVFLLQYRVSVALWLLIGLIGLECFIRTFVYSPTARVIYKPDLGTLPVTGSTVVRGTEGFGVTHYSDDGEVLTSFSAPSGPRIVLLGDSHTEALQVNDAEKYPSIAAAALQQDGMTANFHNIAQSGSSMADFVYLAPFVHAQFHPRIVVIQIGVQSFVDGNAFDTQHTNYFVMASDGSLQLKHKALPDRTADWMLSPKRDFALIDYGISRWNEMMNKIKSQQTRLAAEPATPTVNATPTEANDFPRKVKAQLDALHNAYPDVTLVIVFLPFVPYIQHNTLVTQDRDEDLVRLSLLPRTYWRVVDPTADFNALVQLGKLPRGFANTTPGSGHLNADGHAVVGKLLAQQLEDLLR